MRQLPAFLLPCLLLAAPATLADQKPARYGSFGVGIGTGGLGLDYAYPLNKYFDLRAGYDFGALTRDEEEDGIEYEAELKFSALRLLADYKPFAGGFRITAGLYTGSPEFELEADGEDEYEVGDAEYRADLLIQGDVDLGSAAPYLGLGWGGTAGTRGFGLSFDLGVLFTDSPDVGLAVPRGVACLANSNCDLNDPGDPNRFDVNDGSAAALEFQSNVERERLQLEDDAKDFELWPIIRLGLHYRY